MAHGPQSLLRATCDRGEGHETKDARSDGPMKAREVVAGFEVSVEVEVLCEGEIAGLDVSVSVEVWPREKLDLESSSRTGSFSRSPSWRGSRRIRSLVRSLT